MSSPKSKPWTHEDADDDPMAAIERINREVKENNALLLIQSRGRAWL